MFKPSTDGLPLSHVHLQRVTKGDTAKECELLVKEHDLVCNVKMSAVSSYLNQVGHTGFRRLAIL